MELNNVVIEVTRNCQLWCAHCLRGDAQNITISKEILDDFLSQVDWIYTLTITGGEPSLFDLEILHYNSLLTKIKV